MFFVPDNVRVVAGSTIMFLRTTLIKMDGCFDYWLQWALRDQMGKYSPSRWISAVSSSCSMAWYLTSPVVIYFYYEELLHDLLVARQRNFVLWLYVLLDKLQRSLLVGERLWSLYITWRLWSYGWQHQCYIVAILRTNSFLSRIISWFLPNICLTFEEDK